MKAIKLFLLTLLLSFAFLVQGTDAELLRFTVEGVVGPDVPKCPPEVDDLAIYAPLTNRFSAGDPMKMTFTVDMSTPEDCYVESLGDACYYNGSVVALTIEVAGYRCDYGKADPYLYPADALTYDLVNFGYTEDLFQYIKVHDDKWSPDSNNCNGETVDHLMFEQRLMYGTGADLILTGAGYYPGDLPDVAYTYKVTGCSFAVTGEETTMFADTSLPEDPVAVDTVNYLCRWAIIFGRQDKIAQGIAAPYKIQGELTSYYAEPDPDIDADEGSCFIATAAYGSIYDF